MYGLLGLVFIGLTLVSSTLSFALREYSRSRLAERLPEYRRDEWLSWVDRHARDLQLLVGILRAIANVGLVIAISLAWITNNPSTGPLGFQSFAMPGLLSLGLMMVFALGMPHAIAVHAGELWLARSLPALAALYLVLWPATRALAGLEALLRLALGKKPDEQEDVTQRVEQEILDAVSAGEAQGAVDEETKERITSVIELPETAVSEIMTPRAKIDALPIEATYDDVRNLILRTGHSRVPVFEETIDHVIGVIYAKDLLRVTNPAQFKLRESMRRAPFVPETKSISDLLNEFRAAKVQIAIVLDEYGGTAGIATIEDILEELVGEIDDEYDQTASPSIRRVNEDTYEVDGHVPIYSLNEELGIDLPEESGYETVGGFVATTLGKIPRTGEEFEHDRVHFRVTAAEPRRINRLRIQVPKTADSV